MPVFVGKKCVTRAKGGKSKLFCRNSAKGDKGEEEEEWYRG
jgi:hypothetical protein